jgi:uncharacterized protein DUF5990
VQVEIQALNLPGSSCGPSPQSPGGYRAIHVGVQQGKDPVDLLGLASADLTSARWSFECNAVLTASGVDLKGRCIQGRPGGRFVYLCWVTADVDGALTMFRRAKLMLDAVPAEVMVAAFDQGRLVGRLGLTDGKGNPLCASVRPPTIDWYAEPAR